MKKEIAKQWVKALRSGKYKQRTGSLNYDGKFCCLGVLCELAVQKGIVKREFKSSYGGELSVSYDTYTEVLPDCVRKWAGITDRRGTYLDSKRQTRALTELNDAGRSFKQIANIIEKNYEKL